MEIKNTFRKEERLCNRKAIELLFKSKRTLFIHPFKVYVLESASAPATCLQILITVPKKVFRTAVRRNRIKRLIREAYRKNKHDLYEYLLNKQESWMLGFVYIAQEETTYAGIEEKIKVILNRLMEQDVKITG